jgi:hypothetical protein
MAPCIICAILGRGDDRDLTQQTSKGAGHRRLQDSPDSAISLSAFWLNKPKTLSSAQVTIFNV